MNGSRTALLVGATGLVGGHCLRLLLDDEAYSKVITLARREMAIQHPKLGQRLIDFDRLSEHADVIQARDVFCCLGTTIKEAGSEEAFRKVDFGYPNEIARIASQNGAQQFLLVSSLGANSKSRVFYNRVKGEVEEAIKRIPFDATQIFRPSLLLGEREEFRLAERFAEKASRLLSFLFVGPLSKYRPINARAVATAMVTVAKQQPSGVNIFESDRIRVMSGQ